GKEPEPLLREKDIKQEEDIREWLNGPVDEIIIQNQKEDNDKIRNEILTQLGIKPITLKDDDYENKKNQIIVQKIEQVIEERIIEKENKYLTRYTDKIQEQQDQIDQQQEHNNRLLEDNERGFQLNQQILKNNKELEKELTDVKNGLDKREKDLQKELEKRDQELKEY